MKSKVHPSHQIGEEDDVMEFRVLNELPVLVWVSDNHGRSTFFNRYWLNFTGRTFQNQVASSWISCVHAEDIDAVAAYIQSIRTQEPKKLEYRLRRHDGEWRWMLNHGRPRLDANEKIIGYINCCVDITDHKKFEAALLRSQERLALAQEAASVGTYDWEIVENKISWSPEMFQLYHIDPATEPEAIYKIWLDRLHPEDRERADRETGAFLEQSKRLTIEFRIVHPDGGIRWIQGRGRVIRDDEGRPLRMIGVNFDVTEQRQTEDALRKSEQRLTDIAENFPGIIFRRVTYSDGRVEYPYYSGVDKTVLHVSPDRIAELKTMEDVSRLIHYDDLPAMLDKFREASASLSPLDLEGRVLGDDGRVTWVRSLSRPRPASDGSLVWDGVILDVTEQHRREGERQRAATMLQMGMEVAGIGTWEFDPANQTIKGSGATNLIFGLPQDENARSVEVYMRGVHPDDVLDIRQGLLDGARQKLDVAREYRVKATDGTIKWVASRGAYRTLADGTERVIGALFDITERKRLEEEREFALSHQRILLKELNHRVKNNLQMISSMIRLQVSRTSNQDIKNALMSTVGRVQAISDLQVQLETEGGRGRIEFGAYLMKVADNIRKSVLCDSAINIECHVRECPMDLDRAVPLGLIINELLTNSIKYAFVDRDKGTISIGMDCMTDKILIRVADNGRGMDSLERPQNDAGLGMKLVGGLSCQIGVNIRRIEGEGTAHLITVPMTSTTNTEA